jgi:hypothetical protein
MVEREVLIMVVQQLEDIFSVIHMNLLACLDTGLSKMMGLASICKNFYGKKDIEMGFVVICSSTHKYFTHTLENLNVCIVCNPANIWNGTQFLVMFLGAFPEQLPLQLH